MRVLHRLRTAWRRVLRRFARPARKDAGAEGLVVEPYRGYGSRREFYFMGRVFRQPGGPVRDPGKGDLAAALRRLLRRGASRQTLVASFGEAEQRVVTDAAGYFRVRLPLQQELPPAETLWQTVTLRLALPSGGEVTAAAKVLVPPQHARLVVISDIDDTVMHTGVANKLAMFWRLFAKGADSRTAFPGVAELYRALHRDGANPLLYVSRAPWSLYALLEAFFQRHRIPAGPVLFLRDWGVSLRRPWPRRGRGHKLELIRDMLARYPDLPFVLIGDSGQRDPEVYARVVHEHPGRVAAVYIRNVSRQAGRIAAIEQLAEEVLAAGSSLLLAADSVAVAEHAAELGLVPPDAPERVARDAAAETDRPRRGPRRVLRPEARGDLTPGELRDALDDEGETPPNTLVEQKRRRH